MGKSTKVCPGAIGCSQIKVRDFSSASVSIAPAEFSSWADARAELVTEAKRPLVAQMEAEIAACACDDELAEIRDNFAKRSQEIEYKIDHEPHDVHMSISMAYK